MPLVFAVHRRLAACRGAVLGLCLLAVGMPVQAALLRDVYQQALLDEPGYQAALAEREAILQKIPALRAEMLPRLDVDAHLGRLHDQTHDSALALYSDRHSDATSWQWSVRLQQPLLDGVALARLQQQDEEATRAELGLLHARQQLMLRVVRRYLAWLGAQDNLQLAQRRKQAVAEQLKQVQVREQTGYATQADVLELTASLDHARADELDAAAQLRGAREAMLELASQVPAWPQALSQFWQASPPQPARPQVWVDRAVRDNLAVRLARLEVTQAQHRLQERKAAHWPRLSLELEHRRFDTQDLPLGREAEQSTALLRLQLPLYAGGADQARQRASAHQLDRRQALLEAQRRSVTRQARDAYDGVVTGIERLRAAQQTLASRQAALEAIQGGWASGIRTAADVVQARNEMFGAQRDVAAARYAYLLKTLSLKEVVGSAQDDDLLQLDRQLLAE